MSALNSVQHVDVSSVPPRPDGGTWEPARCGDLMVEQADAEVKCRADLDSIAKSYRGLGPQALI
jgi:hypothetical protein